MELVVKIAIIGTLVGLLLPAVQSAREAGRKSACSNNVEQITLGAANYESAKRKYPTSGEGKDNYGGTGSAAGTPKYATLGTEMLNVNSFFVQVLGYIEEANIAAKWNMAQPCWSSNNVPLSATKVNAFLGPSNGITPGQFGGTASVAGGGDCPHFGQTHCMPVAYTDIDKSTGTRNKNGDYKSGALTVDQSSGVHTATDGTSQTLIFVEASGRSAQNG
jgi:type II secretory pathway pseudopilin PulG